MQHAIISSLNTLSVKLNLTHICTILDVIVKYWSQNVFFFFLKPQ